MPYIGTQPLTGQFKKLDAISVVNGQDDYTMQYNGSNYKPATANALLVSVNGVIQAAGDAYDIDGSTITFTENLVTGDTIDFIIALGDTGSAVTPVDGSVTTAKLATDAVTTAKLANDAVTSDKLAHDITIANNLTVTGTVNASKMAGSDATLNTKTSHTFSNIPSVYNRLTLFFNGVSISADGEVQIQFGTSGGIVTTGYWNRDAYMSNGGTLQTLLDTNNNCFTLASWTGNANAFYGYYQFHHIGNTWFSRVNGSMRASDNNYFIEQFGQIDLSDTLTQIKVSAAAGTFDAGTMNLLYG